MKYFTPDLYKRFKTADDLDVLQVHEDWEEAIHAYRKHIDELGGQLSPNVRRFAESLCLHDADYLGMSTLAVPGVAGSLAVLLLRRAASQIFLIYLLVEQPLVRETTSMWPYSKEDVHWLYDEFDVAENGIQQQEVLLSNGQQLTLRFYDLQLIEHPVEEPLLASQA